MGDPFFPTPTEQPLSKAAWQALVDQDSLYAQRRYRYHAYLLGCGRSEFAASLAAFQRITGRASERFTATAITCLQQLTTITHTNGGLTLWTSITNQPYTRVIDVASLPDLCWKIARIVAILIHQEKQLRHNLVDNTSEWQAVIVALSVVIEELAITGLAALALSYANQELLAPYPDETAWRALLTSNLGEAQKRFQALELYQARVGNSIEFNALESMAIYRLLRIG